MWLQCQELTRMLSEATYAYIFMRLDSNPMPPHFVLIDIWSYVKTCFRFDLLPQRTGMSCRKESGHLFHISVHIKSITALIFSGDEQCINSLQCWWYFSTRILDYYHSFIQVERAWDREDSHGIWPIAAPFHAWGEAPLTFYWGLHSSWRHQFTGDQV